MTKLRSSLLAVGFALVLGIMLAGLIALPSSAFAASAGKSFASGDVSAASSGSGTVSATATSALSLKGSRVVIYGDSIQAKKYRTKYGAFTYTYAKKKGASVIIDRAKAGATLSRKNKSNSVWNQMLRDVKLGTLGSYDYYFIAAGTNDYARNIKCGSPRSTDLKTVCGTLNMMIKRINTAHVKATGKKAKIIVVTPLGCPKHEAKKNKARKTLDDYRGYIFATAYKYKTVAVIDGLALAPASEMAKKKYSADGLHPKASYAKRVIVKRFTKAMKKAYS